MDVVGLYPNIPHDEGLSALRKRLNERDKKDVSTDTLVELAELVLKNSIFNFNERTLKQKRGTAVGTNFAPPHFVYGIIGGKNYSDSYNKLYLWWRYIDDIFFIWEHGEEKLRNFVQTLNEIHPTIKFTAIKFTAVWPQKSINFPDVTVSLIDGQIETDVHVKPL